MDGSRQGSGRGKERERMRCSEKNYSTRHLQCTLHSAHTTDIPHSQLIELTINQQVACSLRHNIVPYGQAIRCYVLCACAWEHDKHIEWANKNASFRIWNDALASRRSRFKIKFYVYAAVCFAIERKKKRTGCERREGVNEKRDREWDKGMHRSSVVRYCY